VELVSAIVCMHDSDVAHRDLKPSNLLLDSISGSLLVTDLEMAQLHASNAWTNEGEGTFPWHPIEISDGDGGRPMPVDVYATALIMYHLLQHVVMGTPFDDMIRPEKSYDPEDVQKLCTVMAHLSFAGGNTMSSSCSPHALSNASSSWVQELDCLLSMMLDDCPDSRPSIREAHETLSRIHRQLHQPCELVV